ncbi:unnamed protein product [Aspergillus oryzae]|nr:unnamed protein product [Aspergillus oryzae]GMF91995.1 unnamed protein product [Aspergillus oryzae]
MSPSLEPLAITGMSLKFPGDAVSPESFWKLITEGQMTMRDYPPDRSNIDAFYHPDRDRLDQISTRGANFLNQDISRFDAAFFSINAAEAEAMDPQQRLILETVYHAFENAGMTLSQASWSKTCVYTGSFSHDYTFMQVKDPMALPKFHSTGTGMNMLSNRVSWFFNLTGPSATVDTACSSSLIALDLACKSIWSGDSSMVCPRSLTGGSSINCPRRAWLLVAMRSSDLTPVYRWITSVYCLTRAGHTVLISAAMGMLVARELESWYFALLRMLSITTILLEQ